MSTVTNTTKWIGDMKHLQTALFGFKISLIFQYAFMWRSEVTTFIEET